MTTDEVATLLRVSRQTVTRWIRTGRLKSVVIKVGSRPIYRIRRSAFREFVRQYIQSE